MHINSTALDRPIAKEPRDEAVGARPDVGLGDADGLGGVVFVVVGRRSGGAAASGAAAAIAVPPALPGSTPPARGG